MAFRFPQLAARKNWCGLFFPLPRSHSSHKPKIRETSAICSQRPGIAKCAQRATLDPGSEFTAHHRVVRTDEGSGSV